MLIRKMCPKPAVSAVFFMAFVPVAAFAQETAQPAVETRVFDIRSLLLEVPNYRAIFSDLRSDDLYRPTPASPPTPFDPPAPSATAPGAQNPTKPDAQQADERNAERIMDLIRSIVHSDTWVDHGGEQGSIQFYAGQLVVRQTGPVMAEVSSLINLIRAARVRRVSIDAWFVIAPSQAAERAELAAILTQQDSTVEEFQKAIESKFGSGDVMRVSLTGFDGQRVYTSSGKQHNVKIGAQPVVDSSVVGYQPLPRQLLSGVALEVQPVAEPESGLVLIDIRASLGKVDPTDGQSMKAGAAPEWELHTPSYQVAHVATSVSLPVGRVSRVSMTRYDENHDVVLFILPNVE